MHVRAIEKGDGSVALVWIDATDRQLDGESMEECVGRLFHEHMERTAEVNPELIGRPWYPIDPADIPSRMAACEDCGGEHSTRDQWALKDGRVVRDDRRRNARAELDHLALAEAHADDHPAAWDDPATWARFDALRRAYRRAEQDPSLLPDPKVVEEICTPALRALTARGGRDSRRSRAAPP